MSDVVSSGKIIQKPQIVIETDDFLPPGIVGVRSKTLEEIGYSLSEGVDFGEVQDTDPEDAESTDEWYYERLPIPDTMVVVSQTVRVGPDKKMVVDVVIETEDYPGFTEFEARIVRA